MPPTNANDPLHTSERAPSAVTPDPDHATDLPPGSSLDGGPAAPVPGQSTGPEVAPPGTGTMLTMGNLTPAAPAGPADRAGVPGPDHVADLLQGSSPAGSTAADGPGQNTGPWVAPPKSGTVLTMGSLAPAPPAEPADKAGVPGYEILGELGRGGMGVVYKARHLTLKRIVALKMILAGGHAQSRELARFRIEAEAVARLQHPNIVQIHEVGEVGGRPFCALEFVEGGNLASKLRGKPLPAREAARLVETLARGMQLAHSRNVVHRDLKPANILLTTDGTPKITDFGLARQMDNDSGKTHAGELIGTPSYMAPEQASGNAHEAGPAADLYALGAILYDCLACRPPFLGKTVVETLDQVRTQEPVPPSRWQKSVPLDLETICLKCLRKEPENRYASAAELADELVRYQQGEPILARPVGRLERAARWARRNPALATALATAVLFLVGGVVVSGWFAIKAGEEATAARTAEKKADERAKAEGVAKEEALARMKRADDERARANKAADEAVRLAGKEKEAREAANRSESQAKEDEQKANRERDRATEQRDRAELLVYAATLKQAQLMWKDDQGKEALALLDECQGNLRGWEHRHLWALYNSNQRTFRGHTSQVRSVAWSPDGKRILSGSNDNTLKVWDAETGQELLSLKGHTAFVTSVAWSPDGKRIVSGSWDNMLKIWDVNKKREISSLKGHTLFVISVAWSPDGKRIVSGSADGTMKVWDAEKGQEVLSLKGHTAQVTSVAWSPVGKRFLSGSEDGTVKIWDADKGLEVPSLKGRSVGVSSVAWSPDGKRFLSGSLDGMLKVWDADNGHEVLSLKGHTFPVSSVAWSPDGKRILSGSWDNTLKVWDADKGQELLSLKGHTGPVVSVAWSPDGKRILSGSLDGTLKVWDAEKRQKVLALKGHTNYVYSVAWSPDGKRLLSGSFDGTLKIWDAENGKEVFSRKGHTSAVSSLAWSPDGKRFLSGSADGTVKVWDADKGRENFSIKGHTGGVNSVAWSPDGKRIVSGSNDNTLKIWDAGKGQEVLSIKGHTAQVTSVAWSPNGNHILSGSWDNTLKVWDAEKEQENPLP